MRDLSAPGAGNWPRSIVVAVTQSPRYLERFVVREAGRVAVVPVSMVDWIGADDYYVDLHVGRQIHVVRESLRQLETRLDPEQFLRIHRSTIVRVDCIEALRSLPHGGYAVDLKDGTELRLSRRRYRLMRTLLGGTR
jgi:two-component system LytT family response regulator